MSCELKCQYIHCKYNAEKGLCYGHRKLLMDDSNSALICFNCGKLLKIFKKPKYASKKYYFTLYCRVCKGSEDREVVDKTI